MTRKDPIVKTLFLKKMRKMRKGILRNMKRARKGKDDGIPYFKVNPQEGDKGILGLNHLGKAGNNANCKILVPSEKDKADTATSTWRLRVSVIICLTAVVAEVIGGLISGSLALLTDAAHLLSDVAGYFIGLFALWAVSKHPTAKYSFGFHRLEILGALLSMVIIWGMTGILIFQAISRLVSPTRVDGRTMFVVAVFGLLVNLTMLAVLGTHGHSQMCSHGHSHSHSHSHSHGGGGGGGAGGCSHHQEDSDTHGHSHGKKAGHEKKVGHGHSHEGGGGCGGKDKAHGHSSSHSHSHGSTKVCNQSHEQKAHSHSHSHSHGASGGCEEEPSSISHHHSSCSGPKCGHAVVHQNGGKEDSDCSDECRVEGDGGKAEKACGHGAHSHGHSHSHHDGDARGECVGKHTFIIGMKKTQDCSHNPHSRSPGKSTNSVSRTCALSSSFGQQSLSLKTQDFQRNPSSEEDEVFRSPSTRQHQHQHQHQHHADIDIELGSDDTHSSRVVVEANTPTVQPQGVVWTGSSRQSPGRALGCGGEAPLRSPGTHACGGHAHETGGGHGYETSGGHGHSCGGHGHETSGGHGHKSGGHGHESGGHAHETNGGHGHACGGHGHESGGHGHESGGYGHESGSHLSDNINVRAAALHVLGDLVQSVGVIIASAIIWWKPEWSIADPICTFVFAILVLLTTWGLMRDIVDVLMERTPRGIDIQEVTLALWNVNGVTGIHCLHVWALTSGKPLASVHVEAEEGMHEEVLEDITSALVRIVGPSVHSTVQIKTRGGCCE